MRKLVTGTRCRTVTADPEEASPTMRPLSDLHLHEQILLLVLRDRKGTPASGANHHIHALGGAVLAELALVGHVGIDGRESALVGAVRGVDPPRDEILAEALALVRARERRRTAAKWVLNFSALDGLHERTAAGLCRRGILRRADSRLRRVLGRRAYPTVDPRPERDLVARLREAVQGDGDVDPRVGVVVSMAHVTGLLQISLGRRLVRGRTQRIRAIIHAKCLAPGTASGAAAHQAVHTAVAVTQAAVLEVVGAAARDDYERAIRAVTRRRGL